MTLIAAVSGGGFCTSEIARHVADRLSGKSDLRFVEFSAHDSTVLAVASCLGLDLVPLTLDVRLCWFCLPQSALIYNIHSVVVRLSFCN